MRLETLVQDQDYKINSLVKQMDMMQATGAGYSGGRDSPGGGGTGDAGASPYQRESDIKFMRDLIEAERSKRESALQEHFKLFAQLQANMASIETEVAKRLKEHRQDQLSMFSSGEEERARLERMKSERAESDHYYVKNIVNQIERRMDEEGKHRMKTEDEMRHMIDNKFVGISEKLRAEEKMSLERERRLM